MIGWPEKSVPRAFRIDLIAKDGRIMPCEASAALMPIKGHPADLVVIRDISDRVLAEKALRKAGKELEHRVNEKFMELKDKTKNLQEVNTALRVLLNKRDEDKPQNTSPVTGVAALLISPGMESGLFFAECRLHYKGRLMSAANIKQPAVFGIQDSKK